jgi:hypothetical protein
MRTLIEHFNMHDVIEPDASVVMLRSLYVYYLEEGYDMEEANEMAWEEYNALGEDFMEEEDFYDD